MNILDEIQKLDASSTYREIVDVVELDFKKLATSENKKTNYILTKKKNSELKYVEQGNLVSNWFKWRKVNSLIIDSGGIWKEKFFPDNCWSCQNLSNIYNYLEWGIKPPSDTIDSFITIYSFALLIYYPNNFYFDDSINSVRVLENGNRKKQIVSENYLLCEPEGSNSFRFEDYEKVNNLDSIQKLAQITHSFGNFMPCPPPNYNTVKGTSNEIKDFLDLMLNKVNGNKEIKCTGIKISKEEREEWNKWFANNKTFLLIDESYYQIIEDIKIFNGINEDRFKQLVNMINARIRIRGLSIVRKINMSKDVQLKCEELIKEQRELFIQNNNP